MQTQEITRLETKLKYMQHYIKLKLDRDEFPSHEYMVRYYRTKDQYEVIREQRPMRYYEVSHKLRR